LLPADSIGPQVILQVSSMTGLLILGDHTQTAALPTFCLKMVPEPLLVVHYSLLQADSIGPQVILQVSSMTGPLILVDHTQTAAIPTSCPKMMPEPLPVVHSGLLQADPIGPRVILRTTSMTGALILGDHSHPAEPATFGPKMVPEPLPVVRSMMGPWILGDRSPLVVPPNSCSRTTARPRV
jgi:hypothetical protein